MSNKLAYVAAPGLIPKILEKIQEAKRPERFTGDFLSTRLGFSGGSARALIPLLKKLKFLNSDGTPADRYDQFRNEATRGVAVASGMKDAYAELFIRNEYAHDLPKDKLIGLIVEITGASKVDSTTKHTYLTFDALRQFADFDSGNLYDTNADLKQVTSHAGQDNSSDIGQNYPSPEDGNVGLNISYTINLNLPETDDVKVFNTIFKALNENLLKK